MAAGLTTAGTATASVDERAGLRDEPIPLSRVVRLVVAAASLGAAAVHASAISDHTADVVHAGAFVAMATFQASWSYSILRTTTGRVLAAGSVGHGAVVLLWLWSRSAGLPGWLPGSGGQEAVDAKDLVATALAVVVLVGIDLLSRRDTAARLLRASRAGAAIGALVLAVVVAAVAGSFADGHGLDHGGSDAAVSHDH